MNGLQLRKRAMLAQVKKEIIKGDFTFSSPTAFTLATNNTAKNWDGILEYSTDKVTWTTWTGASISSQLSNGKYVLYLRGTGNTYISTSDSECFKLSGSNVSCSGNIENLLDYNTVEAGNHPTMANYCYAQMFRDCTSLTVAPSLPATTLAEGCYSGMFINCTALTTAPSLPATTLAKDCYFTMFGNCTALTTALSLPATTLAEGCYRYMFYGCTALTTAPSLPATTLAKDCYQYMFNGCSLIKLSTTQDSTYTTAYRIPTSGTGTMGTDSLLDMFASTGGSFTGTPSINTTYYTQNILV